MNTNLPKVIFQARKYTLLFLISIISSITTVNYYALNNNTSETILDNGLKVIVKQDHRAPVIISQIWYRVGSSYESNGITGISHMLEHMMFKASQNLKDGEFTEIIARNGGDQNAMTSNDFTAYYQMLSRDKLETSFRLESERMKNLLLDPVVFDKEREVVIEERRMRTDDDPISNTYERLLAVAHLDSPYHHPVIGWPDDLKNYRIEDLKLWYDKWYSPNNAIIVVVGDVEPENVFTLAKKYFGGIRKGQIADPKASSEAKPMGLRTLNVQLPAKQPYLFLAYNVPSFKTAINKKDAYALDVISYILSNGNSSRLSKKLEREQELVAQVGSSYDGFNLYNSLFLLTAMPAQGKTINQVENALQKELELLKRELVKPEELTRVKTNIIANKVYEQDSIYFQALLIGMLESVNLGWQTYDEYLINLQAITPADIQEAAQKYFVNDRLTITKLEPIPIGEQKNTE